MNPSLTERERKIIDLLAESSAMPVSGMSGILGVSAVTIRADLKALEQKGFILRLRGGALPAFHPAILGRQREMADQKARIARAAAAMVSDGDTVMIEAGTTTALIARYLLGRRDVRIVTNSTLVVPYARTNSGLQLTVVGGEFRPQAESLVGPIALAQLEALHVRLAFVGTDGFTVEGGLTTNMVEGAEVVKKMAAQAERTVLTVDSSKWGRTGFVTVLPLSRVHTVIVDSGLTEEAARALLAAGVSVVDRV
jgi:DeoR family transcriptional regulator, galactitol utilization operon repressor